jgi:hypothetical protein
MESQKPNDLVGIEERAAAAKAAGKPLLAPPPTPQRKILESPVDLDILDILKS